MADFYSAHHAQETLAFACCEFFQHSGGSERVVNEEKSDLCGVCVEEARGVAEDVERIRRVGCWEGRGDAGCWCCEGGGEVGEQALYVGDFGEEFFVGGQ